MLILNADPIYINQEKWLKTREAQDMTIINTSYTLSLNNNKREMLYRDNIAFSTKPLCLDETHT